MDAFTILAHPALSGSSVLHAFALFVNFFFPALALIVVGLRVAGRVVAGQFAIDDWLVGIAMLLSLAQTVVSFFFIKTNFIGIPPEKVPPHDPTQGLIWLYAVQILYQPILSLVKSSALIFLSRLFGQKEWVRRTLVWFNAVNIAHMVGTLFAVVLQCLPIPFNWDPTTTNGRCVDRRVLYTSTAVFNILTDFVILGVPLYIFSRLRIPRRTKIALSVIFLLGFFVTITSIIRLLLLIQGLFALSIFPRAMMDGNIGFVTSVIETNLALITASAPALRPIFRSRANGGWFATARSMAVSRKTVSDESDEVEKGLRKIRSRKSIDANGPPPVVGSGVGGKFGRGGRRGGRSMRNNPLFSRRNKMEWKPSGFRGDNKIRGVRNRHIIRVRTDLVTPLQGPAPPSPRTSEEPLTRTRSNTNGGVTIRVSDIQREIDGIVNDIASAGAGSYTGLFSSSASSSSLSSSLSPVISRPILTPGTTIRSTPTSPRVGLAPLLPFPPPPVPPPSGGLPARPSTSGSMKGSRTVVLEQHYSASIYPDDQDNENTRPRKSEEIRKSRYGDERRYGVVTPRGTTPIQRGWEVDGRPF